MKIAKGWLRAISLASGIFLAASLAPVAGQSLTPTPQELNPAERAPAAVSNAGRADILAPPSPGACPLRTSEVRFTLQAVTFTGADADTVAPQELAPAYANLIGQDVPVAALCDIRDSVSQILFSRGLLARVEIPEQRITEGRVAFEIIEGYLASVRVTGDIGPAQSKVEDYIEMLRGMRPFDLKKAQRYLLLASDVPGVIVSATIRPAAAGRGALDLEVNVTRTPFSAAANIQNFGSHELGTFGAIVRADLNSFTALGERTSVVLFSTLDGREQRVYQFLEEARFGAEGWLGRFSLAYGDMRPGGSLSPLEIKGTSFVGTFGAAYPLIRRRAISLSLTGGFDYIDQRTNVLGVRLNDDKLRVLALGANAEGRSLTPLTSTFGAGLMLRKGLDGLGASKEGDFSLSRLEGHPDAFVMRADARMSVQLLPMLSTTLRAVGQYADSPLLAYEEMPVGNLTIGRGYDASAFSGDRGIGGSLQFDLGMFKPPGSANAMGEFGVFAFGDVARVDNLDTGSLDRTLRSVGVGLTWLLAKRLEFDLTYAHPLDKLSAFAAKRPDSRILFSLTVRT